MVYEAPPRYIIVQGRRYLIRAPFDAVLFSYSVLHNPRMSERDKIILIAGTLLVHPPWRFSRKVEAVKAVFALLQGGDAHDDAPPCMDFTQDAAYIRAAFLQQYGMDLRRQCGKLSWFDFVDLLSGLTDATTFIRIVQIRSRPMPPATRYNEQERRELAQAKARFALKLDEKDTMRRFMRQFDGIADRLADQAKEGTEDA